MNNYAQQNAKAMAHAITEAEPNLFKGFEFFGECIAKTPTWKNNGETIEFAIEDNTLVLNSNEIKLDSVRDIYEKIFYETYFKFQI